MLTTMKDTLGCSLNEGCFIDNADMNGTNTVVVKQCYHEPMWSDKVFFCDCSSLFGFTGANCDQPSPFLYYRRVVESIELLWATVLFMLFLYRVFYYWRTMIPEDKTNNDHNVNIIRNNTARLNKKSNMFHHCGSKIYANTCSWKALRKAPVLPAV